MSSLRDKIESARMWAKHKKVFVLEKIHEENRCFDMWVVGPPGRYKPICFDLIDSNISQQIRPLGITMLRAHTKPNEDWIVFVPEWIEENNKVVMELIGNDIIR
jgi:hypothetical protein